MKKSIKLFILLLICSISFGQTFDSTGISIVKENLNIIKSYLKNQNSDTTLKRLFAIEFLTKLTGIASESDGNYLGQLSPTKNDLILWERWLRLNEENIYFDKGSGNIVIHKEVKPHHLE